VKPFRVAKRRLAAVLSPAERAELVDAMLRDVLEALDRRGLISCTVVATHDETATRLAVAAGAEVREDPERSYNSLVARLARHLQREGARFVAIVPADLPLLADDDFAVLDLLEAGPPAAVVAPDRHGGGTNLLALSPPTLCAPSYGPGSFARHRASADRAGARVHLAGSPGLALDIDTPEDLAELARRCESRHDGAGGIARATRSWLERTGAAQRLSAVGRDVH
jgi:2-phospho-L-lactate guanylyltransferase